MGRFPILAILEVGLNVGQCMGFVADLLTLNHASAPDPQNRVLQRNPP
jgi:hypothetical protein